MRRRATAVMAAALVLLGSCKVDVQLGVRAEENGSGLVRATFTLDAAAVESLGGELTDRLRTTDLLQAGWTVETSATDTGGTVVTAEKAFATPEALTDVVAELSGRSGPFRDFRLERSRSRFRTSFDFAGRVDLRAGVAGSALDEEDEGLTAPLLDEAVDLEALEGFIGERIDDVFEFEVVAALPGDGSDNAPHQVGGEPAWRPSVGEDVELRASSSRVDATRVGLLGAAVLFGVLGLAVLTGWGRRRSRTPG